LFQRRQHGQRSEGLLVCMVNVQKWLGLLIVGVPAAAIAVFAFYFGLGLLELAVNHVHGYSP
jgi:hypothetical protein